MFFNYFKTALRSFQKNRIFSIINILGLSLGITACLLIFQYVGYELSYEKDFTNAENLYRIQLNRYQNGELLIQNAISNTAIGPALKREVPEVIDFSRGGIEECLIYYKDVKINDQKVFWVDESFINLFPLEMVKGDPATAMKEPYTTVLSESQARRYFGEEDPLGKSVILNEGLHFLVTGVFKNLPQSSHLQLDVLMSMSTGYEMGWAVEDGNWWSEWVYNYILLAPGTDPALVEAKIPALVEKYQPDLKEKHIVNQFKLQPITSIHLDSHLSNELGPNGSRKSVYAMMIIAIVILVIAWINFINLSTAKSIERAREVGIRKSVGARKNQLIFQFLTESAIINLISLILAVVFIIVVQPFIVKITGKPITLLILWQFEIIWIIGLGFLAGTLLSGLYPAFLLSSFQPIKVLKGKIRGAQGGLSLRRALVIFQFAVSIALIVGTTVILKQVQFMRNQQLGANIDQVLVAYTPKTLNMDTTRYRWFNSFKASLQHMNDIQSVSASNILPGAEIMSRTEDVRLIGGEIPENITYAIANISNDYLACFDLTILAGRNFKPEMRDDQGAVIINEKALTSMGLESPDQAIDREVKMGDDNFRIVGVIKDYHHEGLKSPIEPMIFRHWYNYLFGYYTIRVNTNNLPKTLEMIGQKWSSIFPIAPFDYFFLDSFFDQQYQAEVQFGRIVSLFTFLAILIAGLGLFGLISFTTLQRTKEIGIRKVTGATIYDIVMLFSRDFVRWILVAFALAAPLIYLLMRRWLDGFAYRTEINWWIYLLAASVILLVAVVSISLQTIKAARTNPVEALRYE